MITLLVPVDTDDLQAARIAPLATSSFFATLRLDDRAKLIDVLFSRHVAPEGCDYLVVDGRGQDFEEFEQSGMAVLVAPSNSGLEDVVEKFCFRELHSA